MNPLIFPVILIIYSEMSTREVTRRISRVLLYSYLLALLSTMYVENYQVAVLLSLCIHTVGFLYSAVTAETKISKGLFTFVMVSISYVHTGILLQDYLMDITFYGSSLLGYSNHLYKEVTIVAIGLTSAFTETTLTDIFNSKEHKIGLLVVTLWWLF